MISLPSPPLVLLRWQSRCKKRNSAGGCSAKPSMEAVDLICSDIFFFFFFFYVYYPFMSEEIRYIATEIIRCARGNRGVAWYRVITLPSQWSRSCHITSGRREGANGGMRVASSHCSSGRVFARRSWGFTELASCQCFCYFFFPNPFFLNCSDSCLRPGRMFYFIKLSY